MRGALGCAVKARPYPNRGTLGNGVVVGLVGGLVGSTVMNLLGIPLFLALGGTASLNFRIIGDSAAGFFARVGIRIPGGVRPGIAWYYLIGALLGAIFGSAAQRVDALRVLSVRRGIGLGVLYAEVMSLPMLATGAVVLQMKAAHAAQWFGISSVLHVAYGIVLGMIVSRGR